MIISVTNQKGGVGKTTTAINLGTALSVCGKKILLVDLDPQANLTSGLGLIDRPDKHGEGRKTMYELITDNAQIKEVIFPSKYKNLFVLPSSIDLAAAEIELVNTLSREMILQSLLNQIVEDYDMILIDCPPSLGILTINALTASDEVYIPVQAEYFALEGLGQLIKTINLVKKRLNPTLSVGGVIITMYDSRTKLSKEVAKEIQSFFNDKVFNTVIPRNINLSEAPSHGKGILDYASNSKGAQAYNNLAKEIISKYNL